MRCLVALFVGLLCLPGCSAPQRPPAPVPPAAETSGFLDDYTSLRAGDPGDVLLVYRNPDADWRAYDKLLIEPVTLWRSGKGALSPLSEEDLLRLASDFAAAVKRRAGASFPVVDRPGPGVIVVRLGITQARASDPILDVLTANAASVEQTAAGDGPLSPEMRQFVDSAAIEGELRDAQTHELLAQGVDRRRSGAPPITTWGELDEMFARWADRIFSGLAAQTGRDR